MARSLVLFGKQPLYESKCMHTYMHTHTHKYEMNLFDNLETPSQLMERQSLGACDKVAFGFSPYL